MLSKTGMRVLFFITMGLSSTMVSGRRRRMGHIGQLVIMPGTDVRQNAKLEMDKLVKNLIDDMKEVQHGSPLAKIEVNVIPERFEEVNCDGDDCLAKELERTKLSKSSIQDSGAPLVTVDDPIVSNAIRKALPDNKANKDTVISIEGLGSNVLVNNSATRTNISTIEDTRGKTKERKVTQPYNKYNYITTVHSKNMTNLSTKTLKGFSTVKNIKYFDNVDSTSKLESTYAAHTAETESKASVAHGKNSEILTFQTNSNMQEPSFSSRENHDQSSSTPNSQQSFISLDTARHHELSDQQSPVLDLLQTRLHSVTSRSEKASTTSFSTVARNLTVDTLFTPKSQTLSSPQLQLTASQSVIELTQSSSSPSMSSTFTSSSQSSLHSSLSEQNSNSSSPQFFSSSSSFSMPSSLASPLSTSFLFTLSSSKAPKSSSSSPLSSSSSFSTQFDSSSLTFQQLQESSSVSSPGWSSSLSLPSFSSSIILSAIWALSSSTSASSSSSALLSSSESKLSSSFLLTSPSALSSVESFPLGDSSATKISNVSSDTSSLSTSFSSSESQLLLGNSSSVSSIS